MIDLLLRYRTALTPLALIAIVAIVFLPASTSSSQVLTGAVTTAAIDVVLAVALYTFTGTTGIISFGHMGMMAIGGYTAAILASPTALKTSTVLGMPHWAVSAHTGVIPAILLGGAAAAIFAALVSTPLVRLRGLAASLATFAILVVVNTVATNWSSVTGGVQGYTAMPINTTPTKATIWAFLAIIAGFLFSRSRIGLRLRSSREDEAAASGVGVNVRLYRGIAFVISGFIAGVGGALVALQLGDIDPSVFYLDTTFLIIVMIVVGGVNSLSGAVIGSVLISIVGYVLQLAQSGDILGLASFSGRTGIEDTGLAAIGLMVLLLRPQGLMGSLEVADILTRRPWGHRRASPRTDEHEAQSQARSPVNATDRHTGVAASVDSEKSIDKQVRR